MTRDEFATEFARGLRFVLQKHEREIVARSVANSYSCGSSGPAEKALAHATTMTDAAIQQVADHLFDALEQTAEARV